MNVFWCAWGEWYLREAMASAIMMQKHNAPFNHHFRYYIYTHDKGYINPEVMDHFERRYGIKIIYNEYFSEDLKWGLSTYEQKDYMRFKVGCEIESPAMYVDADVYSINPIHDGAKDLFRNSLEFYHSARYLISNPGVKEIEKYFGKKRVCFVDGDDYPKLKFNVLNLGVVFFRNKLVYRDMFKEIFSIIDKVRSRYKITENCCLNELVITALYNMGELPELQYLPNENLVTTQIPKNYETPFLQIVGDEEDVREMHGHITNFSMLHHVHFDPDLFPYEFRLFYLDDDRIVMRNKTRKDIRFVNHED